MKKEIDIIEGGILLFLLFCLVGLGCFMLGEDSGREKTINNFDTIEIDGEVYELDRENSFKEGCWIMPKYKEPEGTFNAYVGGVCLSL